MASNPPGECCINGSIHEGVPKGEVKQFAGVDTYFAYPPSKSTERVILFLPDVMGIYTNPKLLADSFAAKGYFVVMPDIYDNDQVPVPEDRTGGFSFPAWLKQKNHQPEVIQKIIDKVLAAIKELKPKKVGAVGYCFGGRYVIRLLDGCIDAGYTAHPSFTTIEEVAAVKKPLSISAAETDGIFTTEKRHESEMKLTEVKATYQINLFSGVAHGFSVRGDVKDPKQKFAKEQAFYQAIAWFGEYLN